MATLADIAIPKCSTLTDVVQRAHARSGVTVPSQRGLWDALLQAVHSTPGSQQPPLFILEDSHSGETITANQLLVKEFIERWEDDETLTLTLADVSRRSVRTFRTGLRFVKHALAYHEMVAASRLKVLPREGALALSVTAGHIPPDELQAMLAKARSATGSTAATTTAFVTPSSYQQLAASTTGVSKSANDGAWLREQNAAFANAGTSNTVAAVPSMHFSRAEWTGLVEMWNAHAEDTGWMLSTAVMPLDAQARRAGGQREDGSRLADAMASPAEFTPLDADSLPSGRGRANAVIEPSSVNDDEEIQRWLRAASNRGAHSKKRYWSAFLKHWAVLEAKYRNHLYDS